MLIGLFPARHPGRIRAEVGRFRAEFEPSRADTSRGGQIPGRIRAEPSRYEQRRADSGPNRAQGSRIGRRGADSGPKSGLAPRTSHFLPRISYLAPPGHGQEASPTNLTTGRPGHGQDAAPTNLTTNRPGHGQEAAPTNLTTDRPGHGQEAAPTNLTTDRPGRAAALVSGQIGRAGRLGLTTLVMSRGPRRPI